MERESQHISLALKSGITGISLYRRRRIVNASDSAVCFRCVLLCWRNFFSIYFCAAAFETDSFSEFVLVIAGCYFRLRIYSEGILSHATSVRRHYSDTDLSKLFFRCVCMPMLKKLLFVRNLCLFFPSMEPFLRSPEMPGRCDIYRGHRWALAPSANYPCWRLIRAVWTLRCHTVIFSVMLSELCLLRDVCNV
jgi:hypothetical protein